MKNEKIVAVCKIVVQVCNIATIIAQTLIQAFPVNKLATKKAEDLSQEDVKLIKEFLASEEIEK